MFPRCNYLEGDRPGHLAQQAQLAQLRLPVLFLRHLGILSPTGTERLWDEGRSGENLVRPIGHLMKSPDLLNVRLNVICSLPGLTATLFVRQDAELTRRAPLLSLLCYAVNPLVITYTAAGGAVLQRGRLSPMETTAGARIGPLAEITALRVSPEAKRRGIYPFQSEPSPRLLLSRKKVVQ